MSDILAELLAAAASQAAARKERAPKRPPVLSPDAVAERESQYLPHRLVAMFYETTCVHCGTITLEFEGLFEERKHARVSDLHLVRQPFIPLEAALPRRRKYLPRDVPYCAACAGLDLYTDEE